jgi:CheY-like chemotaxis protein
MDDEKKAGILIVDDNPANLDVLVDYLEDSGFRIFVSTSGERAIQQLEHIQPDIIMLDIMMPGMDGFETCRYLKEKKATRHIPIIFYDCTVRDCG